MKNRVHPDFRPCDQHAEVERLLAMGARRADIGQGEQASLGGFVRPRGQRVLHPQRPMNAVGTGDDRGTAETGGDRWASGQVSRICAKARHWQ